MTARNDWTQESIKDLQLEAINENHPISARSMMAVVDPGLFRNYEPVRAALENWNGSHDLDAIAPTLYYKWLYHTLHGMMADELGEEDFQNFIKTFLYIRSVPKLIQTADSPWWNNVNTPGKETKKEIVETALKKSLEELKDQLGNDSQKWEWQKTVVLEHPHPLGAKKPLDRIFNVKAPPVTANEESVNKLPFTLNPDGIHRVNSGPAMRIIIDFANVEAAESVLPTGQSGNIFSPWYADQAEMYAKGQYRPMMMNESMIKNAAKGKLLFN
ncbi:Penicillin amidase [Cecembia lonarensis LW9]|uniref:Penicillin amidase n=1 Tax=Cecembia lonarensis (strain CCUG 58316 / KCTC 22772 / LW9) TaxID=1225176 RepID=K1L6I0_CECL9|nr:Penicillin amidase [Cecembia lonarensis LW9]